MLSQSELKRILRYDPESGFCISNIDRGSLKVGDVIGRPGLDGYVRICIFGRDYFVHRLAFLHEFGAIPKIVDHINGIRSDNRICNLREADLQLNARNSARKSHAASRFKGLSKVKNRWRAVINVGNRKQIILGSFKNEVEAAHCYDLASLKHHGDQGRRNFLPLM